MVVAGSFPQQAIKDVKCFQEFPTLWMEKIVASPASRSFAPVSVQLPSSSETSRPNPQHSPASGIACLLWRCTGDASPKSWRQDFHDRIDWRSDQWRSLSAALHLRSAGGRGGERRQSYLCVLEHQRCRGILCCYPVPGKRIKPSILFLITKCKSWYKSRVYQTNKTNRAVS